MAASAARRRPSRGSTAEKYPHDRAERGRPVKLAGALFIRVEATKFTEVGYVGRDVEQIVRDLVEVAIAQTRERRRKDVQARAQLAAEDRVLDPLVATH